MAIENINSNNPLSINEDNIPPNTTPLTTTTTSNLTSNTDSLQSSTAASSSNSNIPFIRSSNNPTLYPPLMDILNTIKDATYNNKHNAYESSKMINNKSSEFYSNMISNADDFVSRMNDLVQLQGLSYGFTETINQSIDEINAAIDEYNTENGTPSEDNNQVSQMQNVANNYNNALGAKATAQSNYNTALGEYNAANERNSTAYQNFTTATLLYSANPPLIDQATYLQALTEYQNASSDLGTKQANLSTADTNLTNASEDLSNKINDYNTQLNIYNGYKNPRNTTINEYNNQINELGIADLSDELDSINQQRASYNQSPLPDIPSTSLTPVDPLPDMPQIDGANSVNVPNYPPVNEKEPVEKYPDIDPSESLNTFNLLVFDIVATLTFSAQAISQIGNQQEKADYLLRVKPNLVTLPAAFSSQQTSAATKTVGAGSNVGFGPVSAALDPVINSQVMNESQQNAGYQQAGIRDNDPAFNYALAQKRLEIMLNLKGAVELTPLIDQGGSGDSEATGRAFRQALSVGVATDRAQVLSQIGVGSNDEALANLRTLGYDLSNISNQLGSPDLGIQILGLAGLSTTDLFNVTAQGVNAKEFLNDPFAGPVVKENLIDGISTALGGSDLRSAVTAALNDALGSTSSYSNSQALVNQFQNALTNQGVSSSDVATATASLSSQLDGAAFTSRVDFRDSVQSSLIAQGFSSEDALALASESSNISPLATDDATLSPRSLDSSLFLSNLAFNLTLENVTTPSEIAQNVAQKLLENTQEVSEATFRDDLEKELVNQGLNQDEARRVASGIGIPLSADSGSSQAAVRTDLVANLQGVYGPLVNTQDATQRSQRNADSLVGPANTNARDHYDDSHPTLVNVIRSNFEYVKTQSDNETYAKAIDSFRDYLIKPTIELYASQEIARNPAYFYMEATSIQHGADAKTGGVKMGGTNRALDLPA